MKDLKEVLGKKDRKPNEDEKEAKLAALKDLRAEMRAMMGEGLHGKMVKATVAAPDKEALAEGLDKAKDIVEHAPEMEEVESPEESPEHEASESAEEETAEHEPTVEELKKQIEELKAQLKK